MFKTIFIIKFVNLVFQLTTFYYKSKSKEKKHFNKNYTKIKSFDFPSNTALTKIIFLFGSVKQNPFLFKKGLKTYKNKDLVWPYAFNFI